MPKLDADRAYVQRVVEDATALIANTPANAIVGNFSASPDGASTLAIAASRLVGRGASGNIANISLGDGLQFNGSAIEATGLNVEVFQSTQQTITAAGALTLAHGLSGVPQFCFVHLVCTTAQHNYSIGQVYHGGLLTSATSNVGVAISPDATNLNIRYGSAAATFIVHNYTTGATANITNSSWAAVFTAIKLG